MACAGNSFRALTETLELHDAVAEAQKMVRPDETFLLVTSDHGHTTSMSGYPTRGNPILGVVVSNNDSGIPEPDPALALDGLPYTSMGYANGSK